MLDFLAIDAKIYRAREELRSLKTDIVAFCEERARLIVPEDQGEQVWWVYRGDTPEPPIDWSVRVGEFAYNLRSSLDHLVWQLVEANQNQPCRRNAFPIRKHANDTANDPKVRLRGVNRKAEKYIRSIQPDRNDAAGIGHRLSNLNAIGNIDKHRRVILTNIRWTGTDPRVMSRVSWSDLTGTGGYSALPVPLEQLRPTNLQYGERLVSTDYRLDDAEYVHFPLEAVFEEADIEGEKWGAGLSVPETLDECILGVEMVVAHFRIADSGKSPICV